MGKSVAARLGVTVGSVAVSWEEAGCLAALDQVKVFMRLLWWSAIVKMKPCHAKIEAEGTKL